MKKTVLLLLAIVFIAAVIAPTGALYGRTIEFGSGNVISGLKPTPTPPTVYDASVDFIVTSAVNESYHEFKIVIRNTSDAPISAWELDFNYDGEINSIWVCTYLRNGTQNTCLPINQWQSNYTIPAGGYVELLGNGQLQGTKIWDVTLSGESVAYSFVPYGGTTPTPLPTDIDAEVNFIIKEVYSSSSYQYEIVLTNNMDQPISDWSLSFDYDGDIESVWNAKLKSNHTGYTINPHNKWQPNYTIPANGTLTLNGMGETPGTDIWGVTLDGHEVPYVFMPVSPAPEIGSGAISDAASTPEPTPTPTPEPSPTPTSTPTPEPSPTPTSTPTPEPSPTPTPTPTPTPELTPTPEPEPMPELEPET